ncbi:MAG TPA: ABC transporter substrate-binding protein [Caulobacteraceae bacterium]|nr:ABC transporter substrate-binding protein [Caulobacteraceae bacterium]
MDSHRRTLAKYALATAIAFVGLAFAAVQAPAYAAPGEAPLPRDEGAEQFVQAQGQRLISILADKSQPMPDKMVAFRAAVDDVADVPEITKFVLGVYARSITPAQMQRFAPLFEDYVQNMFLQHLNDFHADTVTVKGSGARLPGDVLVKTTLTGPNAKPTQLDWRVLASGSTWKVVDVQISGGSLAFELRNDFVSTIEDQQGSIDALISRLEQEARRRAPAAATH